MVILISFSDPNPSTDRFQYDGALSWVSEGNSNRATQSMEDPDSHEEILKAIRAGVGRVWERDYDYPYQYFGPSFLGKRTTDSAGQKCTRGLILLPRLSTLSHLFKVCLTSLNVSTAAILSHRWVPTRFKAHHHQQRAMVCVVTETA